MFKHQNQVHDRLTTLRTQQKQYHDKTAKPLIPLNTGDVVKLQTQKGYYDKAGVVVSPAEETRSYFVQSENNVYRQNRRHILKIA